MTTPSEIAIAKLCFSSVGSENKAPVTLWNQATHKGAITEKIYNDLLLEYSKTYGESGEHKGVDYYMNLFKACLPLYTLRLFAAVKQSYIKQSGIKQSGIKQACCIFKSSLENPPMSIDNGTLIELMKVSSHSRERAHELMQRELLNI